MRNFMIGVFAPKPSLSRTYETIENVSYPEAISIAQEKHRETGCKVEVCDPYIARVYYRIQAHGDWENLVPEDEMRKWLRENTQRV